MPSFSSPVDTTSLIIYDLALALIAVLLPYPNHTEDYRYGYGLRLNFFLNESSSHRVIESVNRVIMSRRGSDYLNLSHTFLSMSERKKISFDFSTSNINVQGIVGMI